MLRSYRSTFHAPPGPWVLYGWEAMSSVLDAIRRARSRGNFRPDVIRSFMSAPARDSVIGRYAIQSSGETTLTAYGVDRVLNGRPVFDRALDTAAR